MSFFNNLIGLIRNKLYEPEVLGVSVDDHKLLVAHKIVLSRKKPLQNIFIDFYNIIKKEIGDDFLSKFIIEYGSGSGFSKEIIPNTITTDVRVADNIDLVIDAQSTGFDNSYFDAIFAINVFHHIPDPILFINESERILKNNGILILIEPNWKWFSKIIHTYLHKSEYFSITEKSWFNQNIKGPLSGANQALAFNIFERDQDIYKNKFPLMEIAKIYSINNGLRYLLSGGVNYKKLAPDLIFNLLKYIEPILGFFSLHRVYVIRKKI